MTTTLLDRPAPVVDDVSRRRLLLGGLSVAALTACAAPAAPAPPAPAASIRHRFGTTDLPADPQRVVCVGLVEQDALLALGVVPVGTTEWFGGHPGAVHPWASAALGAAAPPEVLPIADGIPFEQVAALDPDLILGVYSGLVQEDYDRLSRIAPTVAQPADSVDYGVPWQELTRTVGVAVGRADRAERLVADVEARFADARRAHPEFDGATAVVANYDAGTLYAFAGQDPRGRLLAALGFTTPGAVDEIAGGSYYAELSLERVDLLDTDVLVWQVASEEQRAEIDAEPLYARLPVATEGRAVHVLDDTALGAATSFQSVLSLPPLLDELVPLLAAAIDGDPATRP